MQLYKYQTYNDYYTNQINYNAMKYENIWAKNRYIRILADCIKRKGLSVKNIMCHGVRNGWEMRYFRKHFPKSKVFGTEISENAKHIKNVTVMDFHEKRIDWKDKFDIVYSNSFDHSYDPVKCLDAWLFTIRSGGYLVIEHTIQHEKSATEFDPLSFNISDIRNWIELNFNKIAVVTGAKFLPCKRGTKFIFVKKL